jgi:hypothetical protein
LTAQPLCRYYKIEVDLSNLTANVSAGDDSEREEASDADNMEFMNVDGVPPSEIVQARQHTMLWNEDHCLNIAPGQHSHPLNIIYDLHAEELSFPAMYCDVARQFKPSITVTPFMMCISEIRRSDRRGVTPGHILYMAMRILRIRVRDGIFSAFRRVRQTAFGIEELDWSCNACSLC